ncbi:MAG TPA: hypothetical protein VHR16_07890, partial [Candidatus Limnocylindrales bacterium]|nr:hypothetical protein [Candidatus Limnocylindrales bacterium]
MGRGLGVKAKRRVVTTGSPYKRRPTVRKIKPAIAPVTRRPATERPLLSPSPPDGGSAGSPVGPTSAARLVATRDIRSNEESGAAAAGTGLAVDMSVGLGRGLVLENPILVASGT